MCTVLPRWIAPICLLMFVMPGPLGNARLCGAPTQPDAGPTIAQSGHKATVTSIALSSDGRGALSGWGWESVRPCVVWLRCGT